MRTPPGRRAGSGIHEKLYRPLPAQTHPLPELGHWIPLIISLLIRGVGDRLWLLAFSALARDTGAG